MTSKFPMRPHIPIKEFSPNFSVYRIKGNKLSVMNSSTARQLFDLGHVEHFEILTDNGWVDWQFHNKKPGSSPG